MMLLMVLTEFCNMQPVVAAVLFILNLPVVVGKCQTINTLKLILHRLIARVCCPETCNVGRCGNPCTVP